MSFGDKKNDPGVVENSVDYYNVDVEKKESYNVEQYDVDGKPEVQVTQKEDKLNRGLSARQVQMIAIAGVIGTGLFLGTGKSLAEGGPASILIGYSIMGVIVYLTMIALGEMTAYIPVAGSFCTYASRFADDALGFTITWNYWFKVSVTAASDLTALQLVFQYWTDFPAWVISLIFWAFLVVINVIHVKAYGELEYWLSLLKVITIIIFIIIGIVVNCGANTMHEYLGFRYWGQGEAPFVDGFRGFASVFVTAAFAYGSVESIGVTAGETKNPGRVMPRVAKTVFYRIIIFYVLSVFIIGINIPYNYPGMSKGDAATSPFTIVFEQAGSKIAGSFINAVVVTSVISAGNHNIFAGTRLFYSLAVSGYAPKFCGALTKQKIPWVGLIVTSVISALCFGASFIGAGTLWSWLQNLVGVANQLCWVSIGITSLRFRKALEVQGKTHQLPYKNWTYPWGPWIVCVVGSIIVLIQGWSSFSPWNVSDFFSMYIELGIFSLLYVVWKLWKRPSIVKLQDMDLETDRYISPPEEVLANEAEDEIKGWRKYWHVLKSFFV